MSKQPYTFLRDFLATHCLQTGQGVTLASGTTSSFYFDCKPATLNGAFLELLSQWLLDDVLPALSAPADIIGGPTMGADFIAAAVVVIAHQRQIPLINASIVRKEPKKHGTQNKIENEPKQKSNILIVEDVITSGGSIAKACDEFIAAGHTIAAIASIIDREAGGKKNLEDKYNVPVFALFNRSDFPEATLAR